MCIYIYIYIYTLPAGLSLRSRVCAPCCRRVLRLWLIYAVQRIVFVGNLSIIREYVREVANINSSKASQLV